MSPGGLGLSLHLHPYFVYVSTDGFGQSGIGTGLSEPLSLAKKENASLNLDCFAPYIEW